MHFIKTGLAAWSLIILSACNIQVENIPENTPRLKTTPTPTSSATPTPIPTSAPISTPIPQVVMSTLPVLAPTGGVAFNIDTKKNRKIVSPYIYGVNETVAFRLRGTPLYPHASFYRLGGNRTTTYNWENNASNAGMDWGPNISDSYLGSSTTSGLAAANFISSAMGKNTASMVTVPMVPFVAANKNNVPLTKPAATDSANWKINMAFKPAGASPSFADKNDGYVYQQEFINYLEGLYSQKRTESKALFYSLDNEPGIWSETHPLVVPQKISYTDLLARSIEFSRMIKGNAAATALVFGAVAYGYNEYVTLQDAPDAHYYGDWLNYFLTQMKNAEVKYGKRLLDVLDVHFYTENRTSDGTAVAINGASDAYPVESVISARVQAPRSLWDASFVENSWISRDYLNGPVNLLPSLKKKISQSYPGTKLSISEYSYGGENHISGAIAQADALGIFAREELFAANYYELREGAYPYAAFDMFRNYDGMGSKVGDLMVEGITTDHTKSSIYAYLKKGDETVMYLVAINKTSAKLPVNIGINHSVKFSSASVYQIDEHEAVPSNTENFKIDANKFNYILPPYSVSTILLK
ncbi:MAG: hypothetical protein A2X86_14685 [Bdellovibrionales bacterium GWA2_49_15]|nr:MAG: hypothetical protein A2X86_14685 [Bdellovibrionales bacterium GWA2_49_15]HAZ13413.1 hypothetical protein [Bdellovibrionales bacterium]